MFKWLSTYSDLLTKVSHSQDTRYSEREPLLRLSKVTSITSATYGDRGFSRAAPLLWNSLPQDVRNSKNVDVFKRNIKTFLFNEAYIN